MKNHFWNVYSKLIALGLGSILLKLLFVFSILRPMIFNGDRYWGRTVHYGVRMYIIMVILTLILIQVKKSYSKLHFAVCALYSIFIISIFIFYFLPDISSLYFPKGSPMLFFLHVTMYLCTCYIGHKIAVHSLSNQEH